jgi:hypothetical protein
MKLRDYLQRHTQVVRAVLLVIWLMGVNMGIPVRLRHKEAAFSNDWYIQWAY